MDFVVYSAVFGGYDTLKPARYPSLCFTDGQVNDVDGWTFKSIFSGRSPKWANRHCKILAHQHLGCDYSIYHDGNVEMLEDPEELITAYLKDTDIAVFPHPEGRDCIYQEAKEVIRQEKARPAVVTSQMQRYRSEGYPEHNGLAACYILLRRHTKEVKEFDQRWWEEYKNGAKRDQLSFNYVCWKLGIDYTELPGNLFTGTSNIFRRTKHRRAENIITNWKTAYGKQVIAPERVYLKDMAEKIENRFGKSTTIVNIGIFRYATMYCLRAGAPHARLVGIDIKKPDVKQEKGLNAETIIGDSTVLEQI